MTVLQLKQQLGLIEFCIPDGERQVCGAYVGDLLSWVMGRAQADQAWITIMSNQNVAAVAALSDVSCVILCEQVQPDEDLLKKARAQGINLLGTDKSAYCVAVELNRALT